MMNVIDSTGPFKNEFIAGVSLLNSSANLFKERQVVRGKFNNNKQNLASLSRPAEVSGRNQLEIVGSEFGSKLTPTPTTTTTTTGPSNHHLFIKSSTGHGSVYKLSRVDQTALQLPRRSMFFSGRKAPENQFSRTWTLHGGFASELNAQNKLGVVPGRQPNSSTSESDDKAIMVQPAHPHSTITFLKRMPTTLTTTNNNSPRSLKKIQPPVVTLTRDAAAVKLPTILKRAATTIVKPIPSPYIQDSTRLQIPPSTASNRPTLQPTPVLPIYTPRRYVAFTADQQPPHLPLLRERMVKANLTQKAKLKCKSPLPHRPESALSRSTVILLVEQQQRAKTPNPLKHMDAGSLLNEGTRASLKRLFYQLDTDKDGHLIYPQVQKCLPSNMPRAQQTFFKVLYDITSETTFFGLQEFYSTAALIDKVSKQDLPLWNSLLDDVDFNYYRDDILELLSEFDSRCSPITGTLSYENLLTLIMNRTNNGSNERVALELECLVLKENVSNLNRLDFIALLPSIIFLESRLDRRRPLFRFRENSILDLHMKRALMT